MANLAKLTKSGRHRCRIDVLKCCDLFTCFALTLPRKNTTSMLEQYLLLSRMYGYTSKYKWHNKALFCNRGFERIAVDNPQRDWVKPLPFPNPLKTSFILIPKFPRLKISCGRQGLVHTFITGYSTKQGRQINMEERLDLLLGAPMS
jgi:hypothetical protein